jgi:hypothetical protein
MLVRQDILYMHWRVHYVVVYKYVYNNFFEIYQKIEWTKQN